MITNIDLKRLFESLSNELDSYTRVDNSHCLDLYIGYSDSNKLTLLYKTKEKPENNVVSSIIDVCVGKRNDGLWAIRFVLLNDDYKDMFYYFCEDIIESSRKLNDKKLGTSFIFERYSRWRKLFEQRPNCMLSENEVKGLIGELCFLNTYLFDKYGIDKSVLAWVGPSKTNQDFVLEKDWYEVKTTVSGSSTVKITSVEQLDMSDDGYLSIIYLDKTGSLDSTRLTLNKLVLEIKGKIDKFDLVTYFENKLLEIGYFYNEKYDEYNFKLKRMDLYCVDKEFPCVRRNLLPNSICNVKYELVINDLERWRI